MSPRRVLAGGALGLLALAFLLHRPEEAPRPRAAIPKAGRADPAAAAAAVPVPRDPRGWSPAPPVPKAPKPRPAKNPLDGLSRAIVANPSGGAAPYVLREQDANVFFTAKGMTLALAGSPAPGASPAERRGYALRWGLVGASEVEPRAEGTSDAKVHHFVGEKSRWKEDQSAFTSVVYDEVRPGVDLAVESRSKGVKYTLRAARGADLANPRFRYDGAHEVRVAPDGKSVEIVTEVGTVREDGLVCYQGAPGARRDVAARYVSAGPQEVGIEIDGVDPEQPLTIDPVITWSTYHGGALSPQAEDYANGIAVTGGGEVFVVGYTYCVDFPATGAGLIPNLQGFFDGFLIKIRPTATIEWATYLGGASYDYAHAVAVDSVGDVYVTGYTNSSDFPTTAGAYDDVQAGYEAFVMKFRNGGTLLWSTFLGGSTSDYGRAIAVDGSGYVYVGGYTYSTNFPIVGGFSATMTAGPDGFVAKLTPGGDDLVWSSYLGGNDQDQVEGIAIDSSESVFVAGYTYSTDFPTSGGVDTTLGGTVDAFLTKIKPTGAGIEWSTYVGGSGSDYGYAVAVLSTTEDPVVVGATSSSDFPLTAGAWDTTFNSTEGFATRILSNGSLKVYSTFLGGTNSDYINGAAAGPSDTLYVTGYTFSTNFPTTVGAYRTTPVVTSDGFVTRLNATGTLLDFSTYLGGSNSDFGKGIAFNGSGVFVTGYTSSANFPLPVPGTFVDSTLGGTTDGFAVQLSPSLATVTWSSYVGGHNSRGDEWGYDVAVDPSNGDVIVTGYTTSLDFPDGSASALDSTLGGIQDVYVTRVSTDASGIPSIAWWTYLGGSSVDSAFGLTVDRLGFPYIVGNTQSTDFPLLNAVDVTIGGTEAFITCLNPSGTLFYSTFLGGSNSDYARAVAVDSAFNAAITGYTYSTNFPLLRAFDSTSSTTPDVFVTVLDVTGGAVWSSYLGGNGADFGHGVALDENQTVYVTGYTQSSDFVVPAVGPDPTYGGSSDAFVTAISWTGMNPTVDWSRYLGGSDSDYGQAISVDPSGSFLYAVGYTYSTNFPTLNAIDGTLSSSTDVFVSRVNPANGSLVWSTYLGGSSTDYGYGVKTDAAGNAYVTGYTYSADFPTKGAFDPTFNGVADAFVTKIYASGTALVWSSFLGGSDGDYGQGIAIDESTGVVYVTGNTVSTDFPALNPLDSLLDGNQDAFIVRIDRADPDEPDFSPALTGAFRTDGSTVIPVGGWSDEGSFVLRARVTDSDDETLQLQVEIQPVGTAFSGITVYTSPSFPSGSIASVTVPFSAVPPAEYHLQARALDATGRTSGWVGFGGNSDLPPTADRDVGNDVADPIVAIDTPTASSTYYTAAGSIALTGTASDVPAGVTAVRWSSSALVTPSFGPADGTDSWSVPSIPLAPGSNLITIQADDAAGNQGTTTITVFRDGTVPTISITPPASAVTGVDSFSLAGLAGDNLSLFNVSWVNNLGGSGFASTTGSPTSVSWNATITGLSPGFNTITMIARDSAGNESYAPIVLHYDTAPPMVSIATPASGLITTSATLPVMNGSASDNDQVQSVVWENLTNATSGASSGSPTSWNVPGGTINLVAGPNVIQARATDRVGLQATASITVYRDTLIPTVAITAPTSAATYTTGSATISLGGTATDPDGIGVQSVAWQREAPIGTPQNNGSGTLASPGAPSSTWNTAPILLDFGVNRFIVTSTDRAGRVSVAAILDVNYSASAPALTVGTPASTPFVTNLALFTISGTVSDDASVASMSYTIGVTTTPMTVPGLPSGAGVVVPWSVSIPLTPGSNVVTVNALDASSTTSVAVTLIYDPTPPAVKITGPTTADDYYTGIPTLALAGTASDNRSVTALSWSTTAAVVPNSGIITPAASWSVPTINLLTGPQTITVTATDEAGTQSTDTLLVTYDPTLPTLTITSPTVADTYITGTTPLLTLAGTAADNSLLSRVTWTNAARSEGGTASGTTTWSVASIPLNPGANPISVIATDAAGNLRTDTLTVYYDDADPTVAITGPSSTTPFQTNAATILLEGTAMDGVEVESVTWVNAATGVMGTATGTTSWSESAVSLNPGNNAITVTVTDRVGRMSTDAITVHYDPNAPTIAVTTPAGAAPYRTPSTPFLFDGTAGDMNGTPVSVGASQVTWTNTTTGGFGVAALVAGAWTASVPLTSGANSIDFTAEDAAGNLATTSLVMTYDPAAPVVQIVTPTTDLTFTSAISPIVLGGTASDDVGIFQVTWSTNAAVTPSAGTATGTTDWTDSITLAPGSNVITITAEDFVGRTGTARITIIYDPTPPTVAITVPTAEATFMTTNAPLSLAGAASDNLEVQSVTWENTTTGDFGTALGTGAWTIGSIPLIEGPNVITVTAVDSVGNSGMATITVTYDATPPTVAITSPATDPFPTTTRPLPLAGTAGDNLNLVSVTWANSLGGGGTATGTASWTASVYLFPGSNVITVTATDAHSHTATDTITVDFTPESVAPTAVITTPSATGSAVSATQVATVGGTADDNVAVVSVSWRNLATGVRGTAALSGGPSPVNWTGDVPLTSGANIVAVTATDDAGNTVTVTITITYTSPSDAVVPAITITGPTLLDTYDSAVSPVALTITAIDNIGVASVSWANSATGGTGLATPVLGDTWAASVALALGANIITVTARDAAGNEAVDILTVTFLPPPGDSSNPVVTILSHSTATTLSWSSATIDLGGTASDNAGVATVVWSNGASGASGSAEGTVVWTATVPLVPGINLVTMRTYDTSGNVDTDSITILYSPPPPPPEFAPAGHCGLTGVDGVALLALLALLRRARLRAR